MDWFLYDNGPPVTKGLMASLCSSIRDARCRYKTLAETKKILEETIAARIKENTSRQTLTQKKKIKQSSVGKTTLLYKRHTNAVFNTIH